MGTAVLRCRFTVVGAITLRVGSMLANFPRWCRRYATVLLLLVLLLQYGESKCWPKFRRWCTRCVAAFTAVGAAITLRRG